MAERYDFYVHDNRKITFNLTEPIMREDSGVTDFVFHIPKILNELEVSDWQWWLVFVNAKKEKYSIALTLSDDPESPLESNIATYTVNYAMSIKAGSVQFALEAINAGTGGAIDNEWHTLTYETKVKETLQGNQAEYTETESDIISELLQTVRDRINQLVGGATPEVKDSTAEMTDHKKIYVLSTDGNWYRYNGTAWVSGGQYASGITIDPTLTQSGQAADALITGSSLDSIADDIASAFDTSVNLFRGTLVQGIISSSGVISNLTSAIVYDRKIPVTGGETVIAVLKYGTGYPRYTYWAQFDSGGTLLSRGPGTGANINAKTHQYYGWITTAESCAYVQPYFMASGSNPLNAGDYSNPKLYYGTAPNDLVNITPLYMHSENVHLLTTTEADICGSDLDNLPNNRHYAVNITDGSLLNAPITQMTGRIVTYGRNASRSVGDIQIFYHTSGKVYFRIVWSSVWQAWHLLNDNGLPQVKILAVGDSICRGARNSYKGFVGDLGLDYKNIGVGDATLSNVNTGATNIPDALVAETAYNPDVIVADGGINDYHYEAPLGTIPTAPATTDTEANALDRSTVMGGAGYLFYQMIKKFPNAQRFFIITHKTQWNTGSAKDGYCPTRQNTQGYTQKDLHDALVAICNVYGVKVIDVYHDSLINSAFSQYRSPTAWSTDSTVAEQYMVDADGVHPTANGYINGYVPLVRQALAIGTA